MDAASPSPAARSPSRVVLWRGLAAAVLGPALVTFVRLAFFRNVDASSPFLFYFIAIALAAWLGGRAAGGVATLLAACLGTWASPSVAADFEAHALESAVRLAFWVAEGLGITLLIEQMHSQERRSVVAAQDARMALAKLESVLAGVDDGITVQDAQGRLIYANAQAARLSGYPDPESFLRAPVKEVMPVSYTHLTLPTNREV